MTFFNFDLTATKTAFYGVHPKPPILELLFDRACGLKNPLFRMPRLLQSLWGSLPIAINRCC